jgi:hypothetical protein
VKAFEYWMFVAVLPGSAPEQLDDLTDSLFSGISSVPPCREVL